MKKWGSYNSNVPIDVIPCCADMVHFSLTDQEQKSAARKELDLPDDELVLVITAAVRPAQ